MKDLLLIILLVASVLGCTSTTTQLEEKKKEPNVEIEVKAITLTEEQVKELRFIDGSTIPPSK